MCFKLTAETCERPGARQTHKKYIEPRALCVQSRKTQATQQKESKKKLSSINQERLVTERELHRTPKPKQASKSTAGKNTKKESYLQKEETAEGNCDC